MFLRTASPGWEPARGSLGVRNWLHLDAGRRAREICAPGTQKHRWIPSFTTSVGRTPRARWLRLQQIQEAPGGHDRRHAGQAEQVAVTGYQCGMPLTGEGHQVVVIRIARYIAVVDGEVGH